MVLIGRYVLFLYVHLVALGMFLQLCLGIKFLCTLKAHEILLGLAIGDCGGLTWPLGFVAVGGTAVVTPSLV